MTTSWNPEANVLTRFRLCAFRLCVRILPGALWFKKVDAPPVLVVSCGGVGTTFLMDHLSKFEKSNDSKDRDGFKHLPALNRKLIESRKILFIYGNTDDVFRSLERRGFLAWQAAKLGSLVCQFTTGNIQKRYLKKAIDDQVSFFLSVTNPNVLSVRYEDIWKRKNEIAQHFGIVNERFLSEFPERKPRTSEAPA